MKTGILETPAAVSVVAGILGRIGGKSRSSKKLLAVKRNLIKARRAKLRKVA